MNPETIEHILLQPVNNDGDRWCGCPIEPTDTRLLCPYHTGYNEGIDLIRNRPGFIEELVAKQIARRDTKHAAEQETP